MKDAPGPGEPEDSDEDDACEEEYEGPEHFEDEEIRRRWLGGHRRSREKRDKGPARESDPFWAPQEGYEDDDWDTSSDMPLMDVCKQVTLGVIYIVAVVVAIPIIIMMVSVGLDAGLGFLKVLWPYG